MPESREADKKKIREIISKIFFIDGDDIDENDSFIDQGILTSKNVLELINHLETNFNISIDAGDVSLDNFISIEAICNYLEERKK